MRFGPKRGNILIIFDKFILNFGLLILYLLLFFAVGTELLTDNFYFLVLALISPVGKLATYLTTFYTIDENMLIVEKGILTKSKTEIPVSTVTTVDISQDLLYQFFNVYKLKIDNATKISEPNDKAELTVALRQEDAIFVKQLLMRKAEESSYKPTESAPLSEIKAPVRYFFLLGLMQSKLFYFLTIMPLISTVSALIMNEETEKGIFKIFNTVITAYGAAEIAAFGTLAVYLITLIFSIIQSIITYIEFKVCNTGDSLLVEYGLLNKKKYTLLKSKISGIALRQSVLMRLTGYCAIEVFVIGYGDKNGEEDKEDSVLYPLIKKSEVPWFLSMVLPEFTMPKSFSPPPKNSFHYYFYSVYFILPAVLFLIFLLLEIPYAAAGAAIVVAAALVAMVFDYKTSGINSNRDNIAFITGIFTKRTTIIKTDSVENITFIASILKQKKGIGHIKLGFLAPLRVSKSKVRNVNMEEYEKIKGLVRY